MQGMSPHRHPVVQPPGLALLSALALALPLGGCTLGTPEILATLAIVLLLFGATRLPALGRALGETVRSFRKGSEDPGALPEGQRRDESVRVADAEIERKEEERDG